MKNIKQLLETLPSPPPCKMGWPWTEATPALPPTMPDGAPWPRISIVTPSYNQGQFIEETMRSVLLQGYPNLEYIVIDGGSTDESAEIIRKYAPWLSYWVSERDRGQSHAINKGLARCTGEIFNWINSDDFLAPGALAIVAQAIKSCDAVGGAVNNFVEQSLEQQLIANTNLHPSAMIQGLNNSSYHQPGLWLRPDAIVACGGIDEQFHYAFDWDMTLRYLTLYPQVQYVPDVLAYFRLHDNSKTVSQEQRFIDERTRIFQKLASHPSLGIYAQQRLRLIHWWSSLEELRNDRSRSRWQRAFGILGAISKDPAIRLSRLSLGAVRQILIGVL